MLAINLAGVRVKDELQTQLPPDAKRRGWSATKLPRRIAGRLGSNQRLARVFVYS
jgi:hypothetical protein